MANQIFNTAFLILFSIFLTRRIGDRFFPGAWFWLIFSAIVISLTFAILRYRLRIFETIEAAIISLLPWFGLFFLSDSIVYSSLSSLTGSIVILTLVIFYLFLDRQYKRFPWYKSGRVGFSGLTVMGTLFLIRAAVAAALDDVLSLASDYEVLLSGLVAFAAFLAVFNLARRTG